MSLCGGLRISTTPGVEVVRSVSIMNHLSPEGDCKALFCKVRVRRSNLLSEQGFGFALTIFNSVAHLRATECAGLVTYW